MPVGICKLCRHETELQDSHFLPAWLYKLCRDVDNNKNPIWVNGGIANQTTNQITDYILCQRCETRFNLRGEEWLHTRVATPVGFPIQQALKVSVPVLSGEKLALYAGANTPELDMDQITYFGLSIFWRSSAHSWPDPNKRGRKMMGATLGPYEERLRLFLLDEGPFPTTAAILVSVWPFDEKPLIAFETPFSKNKGIYYCHTFYVPGIQFQFVAGKSLPIQFRRMCAQTSPDRAILASTSSAEATLKSYIAIVKRSVPAGKLATQFKDEWR